MNNVSLFNVGERFPKLTRCDVDLAIRAVKYEIAVEALADFKVTTDVGEIVSNG